MNKKLIQYWIFTQIFVNVASYTFYQLKPDEKPKRLINDSDWQEVTHEDDTIKHIFILISDSNETNVCDEIFERNITKNLVPDDPAYPNSMVCVHVFNHNEISNISQDIRKYLNGTYKHGIAIGDSIPLLSAIATFKDDNASRHLFDQNTYLNFPIRNLSTKETHPISANYVEFVFTNIEENDLVNLTIPDGVYLFFIDGGHNYTHTRFKCKDNDAECHDQVVAYIYSLCILDILSYPVQYCSNLMEAFNIKCNTTEIDFVSLGNPNISSVFPKGAIFNLPWTMYENEEGNPELPLDDPENNYSDLDPNESYTLILPIVETSTVERANNKAIISSRSLTRSSGMRLSFNTALVTISMILVLI